MVIKSVILLLRIFLVLVSVALGCILRTLSTWLYFVGLITNMPRWWNMFLELIKWTKRQLSDKGSV